MKHLNSIKCLLTVPAVVLLSSISSLAQPLSGVYTIGGTSPSYATLAAAASDLNTKGVSGPVWFKIRTGTYSSNTNWVASINNVSGASATNRITFESESGNKADVTISNPNSSARNYIFRLNNAKYVTIRNMTLQNTSTSYGRIVDFVTAPSEDSLYNCNLINPTISSTSVNLATIYASGITGGNNVIYNNTITNGSYGIYWEGSSSTNVTTNDVVAANTISSQYAYGLRANNTSGLQVTANTVSKPSNTTTCYAMYFSYGKDALKVNNNTINLTGTSSTTYGIYATNCQGSSSTTAQRAAFKGNTINITTTSGTSNAFYFTGSNTYDSVLNNIVTQNSTSGSLYTFYDDDNEHMYVSGNTFTATATSSGTVYNQPAYYGTNSVFTGNTLTLKTASGTLYPMYYAARYGNNNKITNNTVTGEATTSGTIYAWNYAMSSNSSGNTASGNNMTFTQSTSGTKYGWNYCLYSNSSNNTVTNNSVVFTGGTGAINGMYYTLYSNSTGNTFTGNTVDMTTAGTGTLYGLYRVLYSSADGNTVNNNNFSFKRTGTSGTTYGMYYSLYSGASGNSFSNNDFTLDDAGTGTYYGWYNTIYSSANSNAVNGNKLHFNKTGTSGTTYGLYYVIYSSCSGNSFSNNEVIVDNAGSGTAYAFYQSVNSSSNGNAINDNKIETKGVNGSSYGLYYTIYNGSSGNTFLRNHVTSSATSGSAYSSYYSFNSAPGTVVDKDTFICTTTGSGYAYGHYYSGPSSSGLQFTNNISISTSVSGGAYGGMLNLSGSYNAVCSQNRFEARGGGSGTIYGLYCNSGNDLTVTDNEIIAIGGSGTCYGLGVSSVTNGFFKNNAAVAKSSGTCYGLYNYNYNSYSNIFYNNTFASSGTGTSYGGYIYQYPGSVSGTGGVFHNNIFANMSSSNPTILFGYLGAPLVMDYNNLYSRSTTPTSSVATAQYSYNGSPTGSWTLPNWRGLVYGNDKNSLAFNPGFMDSVADLRPDPAKPASWSVNGRGVHITGNDKDLLGNARVTTKPAGVPDLGAYEFTPTSTPPLCVATPAVPVAGGTQIYTFGQDTVLVIDWPATGTPPTSLDVRQYTGTVAPGIGALGATYMYFYADVQPTPAGTYTSDPRLYYKDPWTGTSAESALRMAQKNGATAWVAHPHTVSGANAVRNFIHMTGLNNFGLLTGADIGNNAGALAITAPMPKFCAGTYTVKAKIANLGNNTLNNVKIGWSMDGVVQSPVTHNTPIPTLAAGNNEVEVTLGSVVFTTKTKWFKIWTFQPNGVADPVAADDTITLKWGPGLSGEYTVGGTTPDYPTLTDAIADLKQFGVCGPVWFNVRAGTYTGQYDLTNVSGMNATNRVTIQGESGIAADVNLTTNQSYLFRLNNASNYTIRKVSINPTSTTAGYGVYFVGNCEKDSIDGCNISVASNTTSACAPVYGSSIYGNGNVVMNNNTQSGYYGIYLYGNSSTALPNTVVYNNTILNAYYYSIEVYGGTYAKMSKNYINTSSQYGYHFYPYYCDQFEAIGNTIILPNNAYAGFYMYYCDGTATNPNKIMNNVVVMSNGSTTSPNAGMYCYGNNYTHYINNSVSIAHATQPAFYVYNASGYDNNKIHNNVFANFGGGPAMTAYTPVGTNIYDYNNYYTTGAQVIKPYSGTAFDSLTLWRLSVDADHNSISYDPGFMSQANLMPDPNNPASWSLNGRGVHIAGNNTDMLGNPRVVNREDGVPDIGAYEFVPNTIPPAAKAIPATIAAGGTQVFTFGQDTVARIVWDPSTVVPSTVTVRQYTGTVPPSFPKSRHMYFYTDIDATPVTYLLDADIYFKDPWTGKIPATLEGDIRMLRKESPVVPWTAYNKNESVTNTSRNTIYSDVLTGLGYFTGIEGDSLFSANINPVGSVVFCPGGSVTLQAGITGSGYTYQWLLNGNNITGATGNSYTAIQAGDYSVIVNKGAETVTSNKVAVTIVSTPAALVTINGPTTICSGNNVTLTSNTGSGLSYQWVRNGVDISGATSPSFLVTAGGTYSIKVKNIGCVNISAPVTIVQAPVDVNLGNDTSFCALHPLHLDAGNPGATYTWSTGAQGQTITVNSYGKQKIWVQVDAGVNCIAKDTIEVDISPMPSVIGISYIKSNNTYEFQPNGEQYVSSYLWIFGDGSTDTARKIQHQYQGGVYTLKLVVFNGCGSDTTSIDLPLTVKDVTKNSGFQLYPNPAQDHVTLEVSGEAMFNDIVIVNSIGQIVYREQGANTKQRTYNVQGLPDGHYLIRANTSDDKIVSKPFQIIR